MSLPSGQALSVLHAIPGIEAMADASAWIELDSLRIPLVIEYKRRVGIAEAWQLTGRYELRVEEWPGPQLLIVAEETTRQARELFQEHGLNYADAVGHAFIRFPGLLVLVDKHIERPPRRQKASLEGKAGLVAQVLLLNEKTSWQVKDLAIQAGVSVGEAHRVLARLEADGIVDAVGSGPSKIRNLRDPKALLDLVLEESDQKGVKRQRAFRLGRNTRELVEAIGLGLETAGIYYAVTGGAAANRLAPYVTSIPVVDIWVSAEASLEAVARAADCRLVNEGENVHFLQARDNVPLAMRQKRDGLWLANPVRILTDLVKDPRRGQELAEHLRREVLRF